MCIRDRLVHHPSAGSLYLNFYYDLGNVKPEDMPYLDLLTDCLLYTSRWV